MFEKIRQSIEAGDLKKALNLLRSVGNLEKLSAPDLLTYFQFSRRLGDFHYGALQLEKIGHLFPELEIEKAFFLGELGATKQAIRLLQLNGGPFSEDFEIQRYLQLGSFQSVIHDYEGAINSFRQMHLKAKDIKPVLALVARLNILGHTIYAEKKIPETYAELLELAEKELEPYPLLQQGAFYFLSLASNQMNQKKASHYFLNKALSLGVKHRMRESLLLDMTGFELAPIDSSKAEVAALKKKIYEQDHIVYLDQFHKVQGQLCEMQNDVEAAIRNYLKVIFGGRKNRHHDYCLQQYQKITGSEKILGWQYDTNQPKVLTGNQIIYNKLERRQWPLLTDKKGQDALLANEGTLVANLTVQLSKNLDFAMRDAEIWELLWATPFSSVSSPTVIRTALSRWRKSDLSNFGEVVQKDRKLSFALKPGAKFILPC